MQAYLNKSIKEVIVQFPSVADILNDFDIGCARGLRISCLDNKEAQAQRQKLSLTTPDRQVD